MKRRSFLSVLSGISGSFLIPPAVANQIQEITKGLGQPGLLAPERPALVLLARESYGKYLLHLGDPDAEPDYPTVEEFIESRGYSPHDEKSLEDYLYETWLPWDASDKDLRDAKRDIRLTFEQPIEGRDRDCWLEWDYSIRECSLAAAFRYLEVLPLVDEERLGDLSLGQVSFIEGPHPGSNMTYVELDGLGAVAGLQHRLNQLGEGVRIEVDNAEC